MRTSSWITISLISVFLLGLASLPGVAIPAWAESAGVVSGTVEKGDDSRGLTVRSDPTPEGKALAYLPVGTEVRGYAAFSNGFVKLAHPQDGGWVDMNFLKPVGGEATVTAVDRPDLCLRVRKAPSGQSEKVGCLELAQKFNLTGVWSDNNWAQTDQGWVYGSQIASNITPPGAFPTQVSTRSRRPIVETEDTTLYREPRARIYRSGPSWGFPATRGFRDYGWGGSRFFGGHGHGHGKHK